MRKLLWLVGPILLVLALTLVNADPGVLDIATKATTGSVSVSSTTVTLIMAPRPGRIGAPIIQNMDGSNGIKIVFGYETTPSTTTVVNNGIGVAAGVIWYWGPDYIGSIYGLAQTATVDVNTLEFHR